MTTGDIIIGVLLALAGSKRAAASTSTSTSTKKEEKKADAAVSTLQRIAGLQARANQDQAQSWVPDLEAAGANPDLARALARWIGIQSSGYGAGDTRGVSKAGERGLLQILPATAKDALTPAEWQALSDPATSRAEQARIALKQFRWHQARAKKYVTSWPGDDTYDSVWYAKLHHSRPAELQAYKFAGAAAKNARAAVTAKKNDPAALLRLAEANVVTWGSTTAP